MALTPEDVVNKRFQHVKFRDGYDQDEVDDFLDEVVVELRRLYQENDELRQKLSACEQRVSEVSGGGNAQRDTRAQGGQSEDPNATQAMPAAVPGNEYGDQAPSRAPQAGTQPSPLVAPQSSAVEAPAAEEDVVVEETDVAVSPSNDGRDDANTADRDDSGLGKSDLNNSVLGNSGLGTSGAAFAAGAGAESEQDAHSLISLAQRLHDEHVAEGERTRDKLIADARAQAADIVADAEQKRDATLSQLESQKTNLEREIERLQNFERQYRTRLKSYLTDQLRDLENSGSLAPETLGNGGQGTNAKHSL